MAYADKDDLRALLTQVPAGEANDDLMEVVLARAESIVTLALGFSFAEWAEEASDRDVRAGGGEYLYLPSYQAESVAQVDRVMNRGRSDEATEEVEDWIADEEELPYRLYRIDGWYPQQWYRVKAIWGYGPVPDSIVQVTIEMAVNFWGSRNASQISDVVGVEGAGAVGYNRALTNRQRMAIDAVRRQYQGLGVG